MFTQSQAAASCLRPLFLPMFTLVPMATAPPSPERLELGPGVFWLRSKVFHCRVCPELRVTSLSEKRGARRERSDVGGAGEGKRGKRLEEERRR